MPFIMFLLVFLKRNNSTYDWFCAEGFSYMLLYRCVYFRRFAYSVAFVYLILSS